MPELPEVEIVTRNLNEILSPPVKLQEWVFYRKDLRWDIPKKDLLKLCEQKIKKISRRAKYILFEFESVVLISHLGMTGQWRSEETGWVRRKHDHLAFRYNKKSWLVYEDPRRFGFVEVIAKSDLSRRFSKVGLEPLDQQTTWQMVYEKLVCLKTGIKVGLMDQKHIVGVGNIYASEILFRAGVDPLKKCSDVSKKQYQLMTLWMKKILEKAIQAGGSTIGDYKNSYDQSGQFQSKFQVYARDGQVCFVCGSSIHLLKISGRSTYWCSKCQN